MMKNTIAAGIPNDHEPDHAVGAVRLFGTGARLNLPGLSVKKIEVEVTRAEARMIDNLEAVEMRVDLELNSQ